MKILQTNATDHHRGKKGARIQLMEFGDFQCPYCASAFPIVEATLEQLQGEVDFIFRHFPLTTAHPYALAAAMTAEAADRQGKFWDMHRLLFENQSLFGSDAPLLLGERLGLSLEQFEDDYQSDAVAKKIKDDFQSGLQAGVNGTPAFFINGELVQENWTKGALLNGIRERL